MARKQIVLVIVEGPSDEQALALALSEIFNPDHIMVEVLHYDITADYFSESANIVNRVNDVIKGYLNNNKYIKKKDIKQIIHIIDTDGAFVSDEYIIEDKTASSVQYGTARITTNNKSNIEIRNRRKSQNMIRLMSTHTISQIPYAAYYMSCNLDHVLYNKLNSTDDMKENDAYAFAKKYKDDPDGFRAFICESAFSVQGSHKESWEFIQKERHSLERYTNLGISFPIKQKKDKE